MAPLEELLGCCWDAHRRKSRALNKPQAKPNAMKGSIRTKQNPHRHRRSVVIARGEEVGKVEEGAGAINGDAMET